MGVSPITAVRGIHVIDTKRGPVIMLSSDLLGKLMKASGYTWTVDRLDLGGCALTVYAQGRRVGDVEFTRDMAKRAYLDGKDGPWKQFAEDMFFNRALSRAQKRYAPEVTGGLPMPVVEADVVDDLPASEDQMVKLRTLAFRRWPDARDDRLGWATEMLGRSVTTFSATHDLTRAEVSCLIDALDQAPAPILREDAGASAGPPYTGPAGISEGEGEKGAPARKGTEVLGNPLPSEGSADEDPFAGVHGNEEVKGSAGGQAELPGDERDGSRTGPVPPPAEQASGDTQMNAAAASAQASPERRPRSGSARTDAATLRKAQAEATQTRNKVTEHVPSDPLHTLDPATREGILKFLEGDVGAARDLVGAAMRTWGVGMEDEWPADKLAKLKGRFPAGTF
jgi:hypothetical protein